MSQALTYSINELSACRKELEVNTPAQEVTQLFNNVCKQIGQQAKFPGFRNGKVPRTLILQKYGEQIKKEISEKLVSKAVDQARESEKFEIAGYLDVADFTPKYNEDCAFKITLDIYPTITLPDYKSVKVELEEYVEDEAKVKESLEEMAARFSTMEVVDRPAEKEDFVKSNFSTDLEATEATKDVLAGEDRWIPLTENGFIPGATEALSGKSKGDKVTWTADFPEDFHNAELAGKSVEYTADIIEVHGRNAPELSDEIAVQAGAKDLADIEEKIKESLKSQFENKQRSEKRDEIVAQLLEGFDCDLPQHLLEQETHRQVHTIMAEEGIEAPEQCGHNDSDEKHDCCPSEEKTAAETATQEKALAAATKDLKTRMILREVAKEEKVELNQYEVQMQLYSMAQHYNMSVEDLTKQLQETNSLHEFTDHVLMDKTLDKIVDIASGKNA
ncbi:trigger factor [Lentisphaera araneosa HTCC2155]|uniref:Trigger factor n=1 Tax=Lentisphaera araneosa HTCC2155 TaxID=313628 RepID=A6DHC1_9BACT|nr:trigger factor [Lentisphaera araneosa]EDM29004.1 trigger factor [Lentisphaera araneosa HTCC2155]